MTLLADDISVFGNAFPTVYIKKVVLESSGFTPTASNVNDRIHPHIQNKGPNAFYEEGFFEQSGLPAGAPDASNGSAMKISIDFLIKESLGNTFTDLVSTWSDKGTLQKYAFVSTKLINNSLLSKYLQNAPDKNPFVPGTNVGFFDFSYIMSQLLIQGILSGKDKEMLTSLGFESSQLYLDYPPEAALLGLSLKPGVTSENVMIQFEKIQQAAVVGQRYDNLEELINMSGQYAEVDEDGKKVINYKFTEVYDYDSNAADFLCVHAQVELDIDLLAEDFGLDLGYLNSANVGGVPRGKIKVQNILENNKVTPTSCVYYLKEDMSVWTGHFHRSNNYATGLTDLAYATGLNPSPSSKDLIKKIVKNTTVQDFRTIERINKLKFDLSFIQNDTITLNEASKYTRDKTDALKQPAYFSKNYVSRGYDGTAKLLFGVDFYSIAREQTMFGAFLPQSPNISSDDASRAFYDLLNIRLIRRRVDVVPQSNRLGTYNAQEIPFKTGYLGEVHIDKEQITKEVVSAKEDTTHGGSQVLKLAAVKSISNSTIDTINFSTIEGTQTVRSKGFMFFTAKDNEIKTLTDGHYQYGVELEILDKSRNYIIDIITNLKQHYKNLMGYYNFATIPGKTYDVKNGRFRKVLQNFYIAAEEEGQPNPHLAPVSALMVVLNTFKDEKDIFDSIQVAEQLRYISSPVTGSPRGIETILKLILNAMTKLSEIVGVTLNMPFITKDASKLDEFGNPTSVNKTDGNLFSTISNKRIIKIENFFDDSYDTEIPKRFGYDFLTPTGESDASALNQGMGLALINGDDFNNRLKRETRKYFNTIGPENFEITDLSQGIIYTPGDTLFTSLFSYLSPSAINLGVGQVKPSLGGAGGEGPGTMQAIKTKYSLLPANNSMGGDLAFFTKKAFSYIAAKVTNYNKNNVIPPYDTTILGTNTILQEYQHSLKFYTNQILAERNCLAAINEEKSKLIKATSGLFISKYLADVDVIDTFEENQLKATALFDDPASISYKGGAENSLFLSLIYGASNQCSGIASMKNPTNVVDKKETSFDLNFFNVQQNIGLEEYSNIVQVMTELAGTIGFNASEPLPPEQDPTGNGNGFTEAPPQLQQQLKFLPNQIKSLLLQTNTKAQVKHKWYQLDGNPSQDPYYKASVAINYRNIKRIEYCAGFRNTTAPNTDGFSKPAIGAPVWKKLDSTVYTAGISHTLFCRLRTYKRSEFGIVPMECLEMPMFDEYFLLKPSDYSELFTLPTAPNIPVPGAVQGQDGVDTLGKGFVTTDMLDSEYQDDSSQVPRPTQFERDKMHSIYFEDGEMETLKTIDGLKKQVNLTEL
jgi:hypothetical protein